MFDQPTKYKLSYFHLHACFSYVMSCIHALFVLGKFKYVFFEFVMKLKIIPVSDLFKWMSWLMDIYWVSVLDNK